MAVADTPEFKVGFKATVVFRAELDPNDVKIIRYVCVNSYLYIYIYIYMYICIYTYT
jgi:hypothetical protein